MLDRALPFMSDEHFTVDGTLIEAWASQKSFRPARTERGQLPPDREETSILKERSERRKPMNPAPIPMPACGRSPEAARRSLSYMGPVLMEKPQRTVAADVSDGWRTEERERDKRRCSWPKPCGRESE